MPDRSPPCRRRSRRTMRVAAGAVFRLAGRLRWPSRRLPRPWPLGRIRRSRRLRWCPQPPRAAARGSRHDPSPTGCAHGGTRSGPRADPTECRPLRGVRVPRPDTRMRIRAAQAPSGWLRERDDGATTRAPAAGRNGMHDGERHGCSSPRSRWSRSARPRPGPPQWRCGSCPESNPSWRTRS